MKVPCGSTDLVTSAEGLFDAIKDNHEIESCVETKSQDSTLAIVKHGWLLEQIAPPSMCWDSPCKGN